MADVLVTGCGVDGRQARSDGEREGSHVGIDPKAERERKQPRQEIVIRPSAATTPRRPPPDETSRTVESGQGRLPSLRQSIG